MANKTRDNAQNAVGVSLEERVEKTRTLLKKLEAKERTLKRAQAARREILVGKVYLALAQKPGGSMEEIKRIMNENLTADADRALFDLPPLDKTMIRK